LLLGSGEPKTEEVGSTGSSEKRDEGWDGHFAKSRVLRRRGGDGGGPKRKFVGKNEGAQFKARGAGTNQGSEYRLVWGEVRVFSTTQR